MRCTRRSTARAEQPSKFIVEGSGVRQPQEVQHAVYVSAPLLATLAWQSRIGKARRTECIYSKISVSGSPIKLPPFPECFAAGNNLDCRPCI